MEDALKQLLTLGRSLFEKKQYGQAEQYLAQVIEQNASFADVYNMLGVIYHDQGNFPKAQRAFETAIKVNPAYTEAALNLAVIYNDMGKYDEAKSVYESALSRQPVTVGKLDSFVCGKIANMYADIGDVFASSGMWEEAIAEYRRALALGPHFVDIRSKIGSALRDKGDKAEALKEFESIIAQSPTYVPAKVQYGVSLYSAGRKAEARKAWNEALALQPGNKTAEMYLHLVKDVSQDKNETV